MYIYIHSECADSLAVPPQFDSSDITGQEDPLLLHIAISTMPAIQAQKEGKFLSLIHNY